MKKYFLNQIFLLLASVVFLKNANGELIRRGKASLLVECNYWYIADEQNPLPKGIEANKKLSPKNLLINETIEGFEITIRLESLLENQDLTSGAKISIAVSRDHYTTYTVTHLNQKEKLRRRLSTILSNGKSQLTVNCDSPPL